MNRYSVSFAVVSFAVVSFVVSSVLALPLFLSGCGAVLSRGLTPPDSPCWNNFSGVSLDFHEFKEDSPNALILVGGVIDLPLSLVADVLFLPLDLYQMNKRGLLGSATCESQRERLHLCVEKNQPDPKRQYGSNPLPVDAAKSNQEILKLLREEQYLLAKGCFKRLYGDSRESLDAFDKLKDEVQRASP